MKKTLLFLSCIIFVTLAMGQDTIAGWTFPTSIKTPSFGLSINSPRFIGTENDTLRPIYFTTGQVVPDTAATTIGWNNGVGTKYWIVKFKTTGYRDIKISSKQRAGNQNGGGPKDFLIQWKKGTASYANIIDDTIRCANEWTTGVVTEAAFPSTADTATSNITVRWVLASDLNTSGTSIDTLGISKIDDIIVTGTSVTTGISEVLYESAFINVYPNPTTGIVNIVSNNTMKNITVYNQLGAIVFEQNAVTEQLTINLSQFGRGIYYIKANNELGKTISQKIIVL